MSRNWFFVWISLLNLVNILILKTSLILLFGFFYFSAYALPPNTLIKSVLVNGLFSPSNNNKIDLVDSENLLIILNPLPQNYTYRYTFNGGKAKFVTDSFHISLSKLKKGYHIFKVTVHPQYLHAKPEQLQLSVNNSFLKSWWFIPVLCFYLLLLLGASLYFVGLIHSRNKEKVHNLRSDWTNQLHNDIGGDLSSVALRLEILRKKLSTLDPKMFDNLSKIFNILNDIQKKLRFVFNLVDPKKDSLQVMLMGIYDYVHDNCIVQGIDLFFDNKVSGEEFLGIDVGRINKLYLLLKEILNNTFKYAKATTLSIDIQRCKEGIEIQLKENGIGFDPKANYKGNGIKNLMQLAKDGFMDIAIDSKIGSGTQIRILVYS